MCQKLFSSMTKIQLHNNSLCVIVLQCSKSCGGGVQYRMVVCQTPDTGVNHDVTDCDMTLRPDASQLCNSQRCDGGKARRRTRYPKWYHGQWSQVRRAFIVAMYKQVKSSILYVRTSMGVVVLKLCIVSLFVLSSYVFRTRGHSNLESSVTSYV